MRFLLSSRAREVSAKRRDGSVSHLTILRTIIAAAAFTAASAAAQNAAPQASTGVAAVVNEFVISNYDLDQRTALFLATSGVAITRENQAQIRTQVLRSLQDEVIELQEANKRKVSATRAEVERAVQSIAEDNHLTVDQLLARLAQAGVTAATFRQQVSAQIIWQKLVAARFGAEISVTEQQIDEAMARLRQGADKPQFLVSEIYLGVDRPEDEIAIRSSAEQIAQQIMAGAPFQTVAGQFSQSPSAADGGDMGWVVQGQLPDELDHLLLDLKPGQVAGPVRAEGGYYLLLLRDRREPASSVATQTATPPPPDPNAPVPLERLLIPLPANADQALKTRAIALASNMKSQLRSCADLPNAAAQLQGTVYSKLGTVNPKDLNGDLRDGLAKTARGEAIEPFVSAAGVELIMRCDGAPPRPGAAVLPTRAELQQQLSAQQMALYAKGYLRDLRRAAAVYATGR
jgi:peptidyl-prolyl cis-trans isomerase SurA